MSKFTYFPLNDAGIFTVVNCSQNTKHTSALYQTNHTAMEAHKRAPTTAFES